MRMTVADIALACAAMSDAGAASAREASRVITDSRLAKPGDLFVCLPGERFDGHLFAADAVRAGAVAVVSRELLPDVAALGTAPVLLVRDTVRALGDIARAWRGTLRAKVIAVTGSAGKTTVKEMTWSILSREMKAVRNYKNWNNQIGLPLTLLGTQGDEDAVVLEVGISKPHDMDELAPVARPDVAVIHNVGPAHLEGLGSLAGVARAKSRLLAYLAPGGRAVVSRDYPELWEEARKLARGVLAISRLSPEAFAYCVYEGPLDPAGAGGCGGRYRLRLDGHEMALAMPCAGTHFAENAAAAAAAAYLAGASLDAVKAGLENFCMPDQRFCRHDIGNVTIIDDTYNANPLSMARAMEAAADMAAGRALVFVLGDMKELGDGAEEAHAQLGREAAHHLPAAVVYRGEHGARVKAGMAERGCREAFVAVSSPEEAVDRLKGLLTRGATILVKGSRSMRMEEYVSALGRSLREIDGEASA